MQAAQIDPSKTYALKISLGKTATTDYRSYVARFRVHTVKSVMVRRKLKPTSADYDHTIIGWIDERDVPPDLLPPEGDARRDYLERAVDPVEIEDEYDKYQELVARAEAEREKAKAEEAERQNKAEVLVAMFYAFTGLPGLGDTKSHNRPFQISYRGGIGIDEKGVAALIQVLSRHLPQP